MFKAHPVFKSPTDENVKIWRYLDISKFLWLVEKKSLYFSRCDLLGDPFEGSLPSAPDQVKFQSILLKQTAEILNLKEKDVKISNLDDNSAPDYFSLTDLWRKSCYICSFHMSEFESAALWSIYTKAKQGVAIQSTFRKLTTSFNHYKKNPIRIGMVKYIDYTKETIDVFNAFNPLICKRKSYEHDKEIRAIISFPQEFKTPLAREKNEGLNVPVDIDNLIECIYLAPTTKPWIKELLISIMKKNGIKKPIEQSSLDAKPIF